MPQEPSNGILEEFRIEFLDCWKRLPNKGFFLILLAAWLAVFQFFGNSALGYIATRSLLSWMYQAYNPGGTAVDAEDAHGNLIPFVVLGLFWWKRKELLALELRLWWPGLLLMALGLMIHIVGYLVQQSRISIVGLFTGLYGLTGLAWGPAWLRRSFFPFCLFAFCVPLAAVLAPVTFALRVLVCRMVELISNPILGIGIIREGTALRDPTGQYQYEVAAACSGMRSLVAIVAFAMIYALVSRRKWWKVVILVASAPPLAVLGNVVRMMTIVIAAEIGGQEWGNKVHEGGPMGVWSLLPYVPAFVGLLLLGHWLREREPEPKRVPALETTETTTTTTTTSS